MQVSIGQRWIHSVPVFPYMHYRTTGDDEDDSRQAVLLSRPPIPDLITLEESQTPNGYRRLHFRNRVLAQLFHLSFQLGI